MKNVRVKPWELEAATSLGRVEAMTEVARKMLADGKMFDEIHKYTGLSVRDFEKRSLDFNAFEEFDKGVPCRYHGDFSDEQPDWYEDDSWQYDDEECAVVKSKASRCGTGNGCGDGPCDGSCGDCGGDYGDGFCDDCGGGCVDGHVSVMEESPKSAPVEEMAINEELRSRLMEWRTERHKEAGVPAYMIMHNKTLLGIAALVPKTKEEFMAVKGFGAMKWEKYGEELMKITSEF